MLTHSERNKIAPVSIFFLLYISRVVVSLTNVQSISSGIMHSDMVISTLASMLLTLVLSLPALWCYKNNKNPFEIKGVNLFYSIYFIYLSAVNISRFSYFSSTVLNPNASAWVFSVVIAVCVCYATIMGIEALSRFTAFVFILIVITVVACIMFNVRNYNEINLYPVMTNSSNSMLKDIIYMTSNSYEILILLCLGKRVNGSAVKPFVFSVLSAFLTMLILIYFVNAVMGDAASLQAFPIYALFQLAKAGLFQRIDMLHISFWIFGVFVKSVLLTYCSANSIKKHSNTTKCIISSALSLAIALCLTELININRISPVIFAIPYLITCIIIPTLTLIFKKRNSGDELIEKF